MENDLSTSLTEINGSLIVSLAGEMTDENIDAITAAVTQKAYGNSINGAILNFSTVTILDSYTFKAFENISKALALMGVTVVWVGLKPGVVSALMDLNIEINFDRIATAINLESGLMILSKSRNAAGRCFCR